MQWNDLAEIPDSPYEYDSIEEEISKQWYFKARYSASHVNVKKLENLLFILHGGQNRSIC